MKKRTRHATRTRLDTHNSALVVNNNLNVVNGDKNYFMER